MAPFLLALLMGAPSARALPTKLRDVPVGILALHRPNPARPRKEGGMWFWPHDTTVQSLVGDLRLVEFGSFVWSDVGWTLRVSMGPQEFARWFRCPGARLRRGKVYRNPLDGRRSERPVPGDAMWYYLARDAKGTLYKGTALIENAGPSS